MLGPVFNQELLLGGRRGRYLLLRRLFTGWLVLQFVFFFFLVTVNIRWEYQPGDAVLRFLEPLVNGLLYQLFLLVFLATPALTAGAVTDEKIRGTLQYLLTADLTAGEIVLGKLFGRLALVTTLALATLPLLCFAGAFVGVTPEVLVALFSGLLAPMFALGAAGVLASVWARNTRDAVLAVYLLLLAAYLLLRWLGYLYLFDPVHILESRSGQAETASLAERLLISALIWGSVGSICVALAVARLRGAYIRQLEGAGKAKKPRFWRVPRMAVSDEPLRWKERHVEGLAPLASLRRVPRWLGVLLIFAVTVAASLFQLWNAWPKGLTPRGLLQLVLDFRVVELFGMFALAADGFVSQNLLAVLIVSLLVSIRCSGAVTSERERQTWEALLLTPVSAKQLIRGKLWGIVGATYPYLAAYAVPALVLSLLAGPLAVLGTLFAVPVAWIVMWFMGAVGLWCSVRAKSSWRALLSLFGLGYALVSVIFGVSLFVIGAVGVMIFFLLQFIDMRYGTGLAPAFASLGSVFGFMGYAALAIACLLMPGVFLRNAQRYVADRERTRHWHDEPWRRRRRPRQPVAQVRKVSG